MSIYTYYYTALNDPDPWKACHYLLKEHPRYHDCENCEHNHTCEYGLSKLLQKEIDELLEENRELQIQCTEFGVPPIDPNFCLKYAPKS